MPAAAARIPTSEGRAGLAELEAESEGRWILKRQAGGYISKMSEGRLSLGEAAPEPAARKFLARFSQDLFGVPPGDLAITEVQPEPAAARVVARQFIHGLAVFGSRVNLTFDSGGNLIYAVSDIYSGPAPPLPAPAISLAQSASLARAALLRFLSSRAHGGTGDSYPVETFLKSGKMVYRLLTGNSLSLVYRYELPLAPPSSEDMEIVLDTSDGTVVLLRSISRSYSR
jgi:hypothetical protein